MRKQFWTFAVLAVLSVPAGAQTVTRRATFQGGGSPNEGKCTIEVVVDAAAEVEVRGDSAALRTVSGQPAQWRRFVCTGRMPDNPANFRFKGVDGRGRQDLIRDPRNGGVAVVRIEDRDGGAEGYTFDLIWTGSGAGYTGQGGPPPREGLPSAREGFPGGRDGVPGDRNVVPDDRDGVRGDRVGVRGDRDGFPGERDGFPGDRDHNRDRPPSRFTAEQAIRVCQDGVRQQAYDRFGRVDIAFRRTTIDDNPGRNDWVIGAVEISRGRRSDLFQFSCSVNFENGRVRSVQLDPLDRDRDRR